jgi:hypothetical protein
MPNKFHIGDTVQLLAPHRPERLIVVAIEPNGSRYMLKRNFGAVDEVGWLHEHELELVTRAYPGETGFSS